MSIGTNVDFGKVFFESAQIKEIFAGRSLIYNAEEQIFPEQFDKLIKGTGGNDGTHIANVTSEEIYLMSSMGHNANYNNGSKAYVYTPVYNFADYDKLFIDFDDLRTGNQYGTNARIVVGILPPEVTSVTVYANNGCYDDANWLWKEEYVTGGVWAGGQKEYDLAEIKSKGRLWLMAYSYNTNAVMRITSIKME